MNHNTDALNDRGAVTRFARNTLREWLPEHLDDSAAGAALETITEAWIVDASVFDDELPKNLGWCLHIAAEEAGVGLFEPEPKHDEHPLYRNLPRLTGVTPLARRQKDQEETSDIEALADEAPPTNGAISWVADPTLDVTLQNSPTTVRRLRAPILLAGDEWAYIEDARILTDPRYPPRAQAVTRALCGAYLAPKEEAGERERERDREDQTEIAIHRALKLVTNPKAADEWRIAERIKRHVHECLPPHTTTTIRIGPGAAIRVTISES